MISDKYRKRASVSAIIGWGTCSFPVHAMSGCRGKTQAWSE